ncbi:MAG: hypothetical protein Q8P41_09090 [Pseudomonadota bacterium]|nr:hypothetical protein [Pseudomonadota bacterium]
MRCLLLLLAACQGGAADGDAKDVAGDTSGDTSGDTPGDTSGDTSGLATTCDGVPLDATCPGAIELADGDGVSVVDVAVSWSWSSACQAGVADPIYVRVPADATAVQLTVLADNAPTWAHVLVEGESLLDKVAPNDQDPHAQHPAPAISRLWPTSPDEPTPSGCWAILPRAVDPDPASLSGRVLLHVRRGEPSAGVLPVVGVIVGDAPISEAEVLDILALAAATFVGDGVTLGVAPTEWMDWDIGAGLGLDDDRYDLLRAWTDPNGTGAIPVFFAREFATGGIVGQAGGIPGAPVPGTASSGVTASVAPYVDYGDGSVDTGALGQVVTHELGHQVGLWHTSESTGTWHDTLADTPECAEASDTDGSGTVGYDECTGRGADNVMFWQSSGLGDQDVLSPLQLSVVARSPRVLPE